MGITPTWDLPYPDDDTLISESAPIVQDLAERIDAALSQVNAADVYTVPGTLVQTFTTSGTFTPPAGVTLVSVVVIGGGGNGGNGFVPGNDGNAAGGGGAGGGVRVYRNVPVTGGVSVTVGGATTASAFGILSAPGGASGGANDPGLAWNSNGTSFGGPGGIIAGFSGRAGRAGPTVNGANYAGGGGGGKVLNGTAGAGGAGGGGAGGPYPTNGTAGLGGGGGGAGGVINQPQTGALGGSGRVMVYTEQPF